MAARFRIDQTGPGNGTLDRSRTDLVAGAAIDLVVPSPVAGATYSWEIVYKFGSTATLSGASGTSVNIGPGGSVPAFCAFLIQLTETIGSTSTRRRRIAAVRGVSKGTRPLVFGETANPNSTRTTRNADDSTDNEIRTDLDDVTGDNSQSWTGWIEALNETLAAFENSIDVDFAENAMQLHGGTALRYVAPDTEITRLSVPGTFAVPGTAMEGVSYNSNATVFEGRFARFDVSGGTCVATLAANIPIGGSCVVKLAGAPGGNQVDIVDEGAALIDGVATYSLTTANQAVRLTKMENSTWAVG